MKKILLTGATGMIGNAIIEKALQNNYKVTCIVHKGSNRKASIPKNQNISIIECNIDEYKNLELKEKHDIFMHLAWDKTSGNGRDNVEVQMNNIQYTLDAVNLAHRTGCTVFIGAGSQAEYGIQEKPLTPTTPVNPESGYGIAKYTAGKFSAMLCKQFNIRFNWVRILSIYGKNDAPHTLISYVISELKANRSPELTNCEQIWDYLNCEDAAKAFIAIAEKGTDGVFYPLGSGNGMKLSEYLETIKEIINPKIELHFGTKPYYPHQPMYLVADITELTKDTDWKPEINFREEIRKLK